MKKYYVLLFLPIYLNLFSSENAKNQFKLLPVDIARLIIREIAFEKDLFTARKNLSLTAQVSQGFLALAKFVINMPNIKEKMFYYIAKDAWITEELLSLNPGKCFSTKDNIGYLIEEKEQRKIKLKRVHYGLKRSSAIFFMCYDIDCYKILPVECLTEILKNTSDKLSINVSNLKICLSHVEQASTIITTLSKNTSIEEKVINQLCTKFFSNIQQ